MPIDGGARFSAKRASPDRRASNLPIAGERLAEHVTDDHRSLVVPWPVGNRNVGPGEFSLVFEVGAPYSPNVMMRRERLPDCFDVAGALLSPEVREGVRQ